jgi:hypothetical protein
MDPSLTFLQCQRSRNLEDMSCTMSPFPQASPYDGAPRILAARWVERENILDPPVTLVAQQYPESEGAFGEEVPPATWPLVLSEETCTLTTERSDPGYVLAPMCPHLPT